MFWDDIVSAVSQVVNVVSDFTQQGAEGITSSFTSTTGDLLPLEQLKTVVDEMVDAAHITGAEALKMEQLLDGAIDPVRQELDKMLLKDICDAVSEGWEVLDTAYGPVTQPVFKAIKQHSAQIMAPAYATTDNMLGEIVGEEYKDLAWKGV